MANRFLSIRKKGVPDWEDWRPPGDGGNGVMEIGAAGAQAQVWIIVGGLKIGHALLRGILATLPPSPQELDPEVDLEEEVEVRIELRRVIQCVLTDYIEPAIRDLTAATEYKPASVPAETGSSPNEKR
ncbi:MAG TPA: hypothetical protein VGS07_23875 [Thermoanaerobaculia bacterium]|jgi:hypothetical protein|nr:hypothetical protein [Thermoanaerobaculia bacterium]